MEKLKTNGSKFSDKQSFWAFHLERSQQSGLTQTEYCKKHGLSSPSYYYWKRRLKNSSAAAGKSPTVRLVALGQAMKSELQRPTNFPPIRVAVGPCSVEIPSDFEPGHLAAVLKVMAGL